MIRKIEFGDQWPENIPVESDPVRPELDRRYRHTGGREVYTNEGAILCVAYCDKVPRTLLELSYWEGLDYAIFYTVWSKQSGCGKQIVLDAFKHLTETKPWVRGFYTLSPKTKMAWNFHINNGASLFRENEESDNYEYSAAEFARENITIERKDHGPKY